MFINIRLKNTRAETLGKAHKPLKYASLIGILAAGPLFGAVGHLAGFLTLAGATAVTCFIVAREYAIDSFYKIRSITDLRLKLLAMHDTETPLESIAKESQWRGEEVDPEVTEQLAKIRKDKQEVKDKFNKLMEELTKTLIPEPVAKPTEDKPN